MEVQKLVYNWMQQFFLPFLNIGETFAIFILSGNIPVDKD